MLDNTAPGARPRRAWTAVAALAVYLAISFLFFGLPVVSHPGRSLVGSGVDAQIFVWSLAWWPHAILDGSNPFHADVIWAPEGVNLAWTTSVPALALLLAPVTLAAGPVVAYNTAAVLLPAVAAWTAFLLCRHVTGRLWPSLAGGYLFGFSSYMLGHEQGHLHMTAVFLAPLVALAVLRWVEGGLGDRRLALWLGVLFAVQLGLSTEHAFTMAVALAVALALAYAVVPARRERLAGILRPLAGGAGLAVVLASPLLFYALRDFEPDSINLPEQFPADLANLVVPTGIHQLSDNWGLTGIASRFPGNDAEAGAYLGLPLLAMVVLYAAARWRTPGGRFLLGAFALATVAALGTALHVAGRELVALPYAALARLPLFNNVLPVRWIVYATLAAAVIVALWTASPGRRWPRVVLPVLAAVALLPHFGTVPYLGHGYWHTSPKRPAFFADGLYRTCLQEGETVLVLPFGPNGDSMLWQAESDFWFRLAGGYVSPHEPDSYTVFPGFGQITEGRAIGEGDLRRLADAKGITTILVPDDPESDELAEWNRLLPQFIPVRTAVGGVFLYPLAPGPSVGEECRAAGRAG